MRNTRQTMALISALPLGVALQAQTAPVAPAEASPAPTASDADVVVLDPFTVTTEYEGYKAVDTLAGGRVRTELKDTPAALSVVTSKFMQDLGVTNAESLLVYTNNTEIAGLSGNFSGLSSRGTGVALAGGAENNRLTKPGEVNRSRGLTAMDNTRNYFATEIPWDGYNISRIDISRGPNSFLFGVGSPSGISNASTNEAMFADKGSVEVHLGSFGSTRESLDVNQVLIPSQLAIRVDLVNDDKRYQQDPAFNHSKRAYGALRFDPKFLKSDSAYTKIQASFEHGDVKSNSPRMLPPVDYVTGYLNDSAASPVGYDPWQYTMDTNISADPRSSLWAGSGSVGNQYQWGNGPQLYWDAKTGAMLFAGAASSTSPTGNGFGATSNTYNVHTVGYSGYAKAVNYLWRQAHGNNEDDAPFKGAYRGTVKYYDETLADPSVFDFYNNLIDGDNKREWQRWNAYNLNLIQSLFDERLVLQAVMSREEYHRGDEGILSSRTPTIMLDLNSYKLNANPSWLPGAETNPNVGRPLVFGDQGSRNTSDITRENYQVTTVYNLNFERDFSSSGLWAKILGRHEFTGLASRNERHEDSRNYRLNGIDYSYNILTETKTNAREVDNNYNWLAYLGPSMLGSSGARTGLSRLEEKLIPASNNSYSYYSRTWTAGSSVNPADPWTYTGKDGSLVTQVQADNPANYRGYTGVDIPTIYRGSDVLATGGQKRYDKITSLAFLYQGHLWEDTIVPTFGYRRDTTFQRGMVPTEKNGYVDPTTGIVSYDFDVNSDPGVETTTISRSYGVAVHLPKMIKKHLPEGTDLTLYYFHGANETPKVRYGLDGSQLPNETGETDDYSVQFDGFRGRLTARLTYFKTVNKNAFASVGQPLGTGMVKSLPEWTLLLHAYSMVHQNLPKDANGYFILPSANWEDWTKESWANWPYGWMADHPAEAAAVNQAMMTTFADAFPQSYWDAYGYNIDMAAVRAGDWAHVVRGTDYPYFPPQTGGAETIHGQYPTIDQNLESKGFELEVTFRPLSNWDLTFNASKVDATQTGYGEAASRHLQAMADVFLGSPIQYAGIWGTYEGAKNSFLQDIWAPYLTQIALIGSEQPELRKYRFNVISNYRFDTGRLKGFNVGGAFRWQGKAVNGYRIHKTEIYGETSWIADVSQPIYGPTDEHFDLWIGYERALTPKVTWRTQLNLRNVGESKGLVPITYQPDGSVAQSRIQEGMTYDLSMKFMF